MVLCALCENFAHFAVKKRELNCKEMKVQFDSVYGIDNPVYGIDNWLPP